MQTNIHFDHISLSSS